MPAVQSVRVIRRKIRSIGNIKKITRAMQMVSASKLKKVQERLMAIRPYADQIARLMDDLSRRAQGLDDPLLRPREAVKRVAAVVIMADKGLCGSYNANLFRYAQRFLGEAGRSARPPRLTTVGRRALEAYRRLGVEPAESYQQVPIDVPFAEIRKMTAPLVQSFLAGETDEVYLLFTRYVNAITFQPGQVRFLPVTPAGAADAGGAGAGADYLFEPEPALILGRLVPRYLEVTFHRYLMESMSSEHAARMNAMRNATDNATEMIDSLTLTYNKARQAGITKELLDIVGGVEALKG
jgi:F-type H+-transporting ATPase subunit gamma